MKLLLPSHPYSALRRALASAQIQLSYGHLFQPCRKRDAAVYSIGLAPAAVQADGDRGSAAERVGAEVERNLAESLQEGQDDLAFALQSNSAAKPTAPRNLDLTVR